MRKKMAFFSVLLLCILMSFAGCGEEEKQIELSEHQKAWIADIDGPMRETLAASAGIIEHMTDEEREARLDGLIERIQTENLDDQQIAYAVRELICEFKIAHMGFSRSKEYIEETDFDVYPIAGKWFGDDFYIIAAAPEYENCVGQRLVAIEGMKLEEVVESYSRILIKETGQAVHNYTQVVEVPLEHTGCILYTTEHEDFSYVLDQRAKDVNKGVEPDVEVCQTYQDYVNGIDTVYQKAVE